MAITKVNRHEKGTITTGKHGYITGFESVLDVECDCGKEYDIVAKLPKMNTVEEKSYDCPDCGEISTLTYHIQFQREVFLNGKVKNYDLTIEPTIKVKNESQKLTKNVDVSNLFSNSEEMIEHYKKFGIKIQNANQREQ